jgi:7-cyano-7-deazaguanine synthase in queuosine biosynthesis
MLAADQALAVILNQDAGGLLSPLERLYCQYAKLMGVVYANGLLVLPEHLTLDTEAVMSYVRNWKQWFPRERRMSSQLSMLHLIAEKHIRAQMSVLDNSFSEQEKDQLMHITIGEALAVNFLLCDMRSSLEETPPVDGQPSKTVVCFSGGLDSVLAAILVADRRDDKEPMLFHLNYAGPYSEKEYQVADKVSEKLRRYIANHTQDEVSLGLNFVTFPDNEGGQIVEEQLVDGYIIPGRNGFIALTAAIFNPYADRIVMTGHYRDEQGQNVGAVDKNYRFFSELSDLLSTGYGQTVRVECLTMNVSKPDTLQWAATLPKLDTDLEGYRNSATLPDLLKATTSCYHPLHLRCGDCSSCYKRYVAMTAAGFDDAGYTVSPPDSENWAKHQAKEASKGRSAA